MQNIIWKNKNIYIPTQPVWHRTVPLLHHHNADNSKPVARMVDLPQHHPLDLPGLVELGLLHNCELVEMFQAHHLDKLVGDFPSQHW
jgi:hypothetical protein